MATTVNTDRQPGWIPAWIRTGMPAARWRNAVLVVVLTALLCAAGIGARVALADRGSDGPAVMPQSTAMQQQFGIRFTRVAVVADGGLITLSYVVLDPEKAQLFQDDRAHPPKLSSESRSLSTTRVALMKQGHTLRAGQTYYLVYENTRGAIRPGEKITITDGSLSLAHVPVLK